jgi:hypothetical protein
VLWKEIQSLQVEERYDYDALTQHQIRKVRTGNSRGLQRDVVYLG